MPIETSRKPPLAEDTRKTLYLGWAVFAALWALVPFIGFGLSSASLTTTIVATTVGTLLAWGIYTGGLWAARAVTAT